MPKVPADTKNRTKREKQEKVTTSNENPLPISSENLDSINVCTAKIDEKPLTKRQSPIDITSDIVCHDPENCKADALNMVYTMGDCCDVVTTQGGFQVNVTKNCTSTFSAAHLDGNYQLAQFHAHWSKDGSCGSEHTIDGKPLSGEVHFVYFNKKYGSFAEALNQEDGLAVLGVFLKEGSHSTNYQPLIEAVKKAKASGKPEPMPNNFVLEQLLPPFEDRDYITYDGSLTTPPYTETVTWTVLIHPVEVSKEQLDVLRSIVSSNWRECQDLCNRVIKGSRQLRA